MNTPLNFPDNFRQIHNYYTFIFIYLLCILVHGDGGLVKTDSLFNGWLVVTGFLLDDDASLIVTGSLLDDDDDDGWPGGWPTISIVPIVSI